MGAKTREKMKGFPFEKVRDMQARSDELALMAFDALELANHYRSLLQDERYKHHTERFHHPWDLSLEQNGVSSPFVSVSIVPETEAVSVRLNKDLLQDSTNQELVEPTVKSMVASLNEEYRSIYGLGIPAALTLKGMKMGGLATGVVSTKQDLNASELTSDSSESAPEPEANPKAKKKKSKTAKST